MKIKKDSSAFQIKKNTIFRLILSLNIFRMRKIRTVEREQTKIKEKPTWKWTIKELKQSKHLINNGKNASNDKYFIGYKDRNTHNQWKIIENFPIKKIEKKVLKCVHARIHTVITVQFKWNKWITINLIVPMSLWARSHYFSYDKIRSYPFCEHMK